MSLCNYNDRNYSAEISAFCNRIGAADSSSDDVVKAFTTATYANRPDVDANAESVTPTMDNVYSDECHLDVVAQGSAFLNDTLKAYLRFNLPAAPEELIERTAAALCCDELLCDVGKHLGIDVLVRTAEHPPSTVSVANCFKALFAVLKKDRAQQIIIDFIVPQLLDIDFVEVLPLKNPLSVLTDLLLQSGASEVEPRLLRTIGEVSAQPVFVVGIYKDQQTIVGQSAGESVEIAVDMAAREGLLRLWSLTSDRVFLFGERALQSGFEKVSKENYRLSQQCHSSVDLSIEESTKPPFNLVEVALKYKDQVESVVGRSYTKRLRHKFSRGSLAKRSFRYLVKPKVYTVA